jgi:hypothetical protein
MDHAGYDLAHAGLAGLNAPRLRRLAMTSPATTSPTLAPLGLDLLRLRGFEGATASPRSGREQVGVRGPAE